MPPATLKGQTASLSKWLPAYGAADGPKETLVKNVLYNYAC
jgi:hypothetical protein